MQCNVWQMHADNNDCWCQASTDTAGYVKVNLFETYLTIQDIHPNI